MANKSRRARREAVRRRLDVGTPHHAKDSRSSDLPQLPERKRKLDLRLYGGLLVVFVAGSALALVPDCTKQAAVASVK
jgi:hypothetical protein